MIIVRLSGGMGNQLFQYSLGRALSLQYDVPLKLDTTFLDNQTATPLLRPTFVPRPYALDVFDIKATRAKKEDIPWFGRPFLTGILMQGIDALFRKLAIFPGWERKFQFDAGVLSLGSHVYLAGYWQSEKYFAPYMSIVKDDLVLREPLMGREKALAEEMRGCTSVCVHFRRGDIAASTVHGGVSLSYYTDAIAHIRARVHIDKLYIFSDDSAWVKNTVSFDYPTEFVDERYDGGVHGEKHLILMSTCKHFVIANSTFSWWGAWLGKNPDKIVVAPKKWFNDEAVDTTDLIPSSWSRV